MQSLINILPGFIMLFLVFACEPSKGNVTKDTQVNNKKSKEFPLKGTPNTSIDYDLDKNGKKDCTAIYDDRGHLAKLELDTNENGKVDRVIMPFASIAP